MLAQQRGLCTLCGEVPKKASVDHDHKTRTVRAILCNHYNLAIGHARENPELREKMAAYRRHHRSLAPVDVFADQSGAG
jgi:hypothetical protein